ncbi:MAG: hypothetical protein J2P46_18430, partial [Zavarzinella sp.]|nr:hypothetical protein [Zavarzinella sp.]
RLTLRDLPIPAKLVVSAFLISVGIGYLWAMAQIHFKHASAGNPLPTTADLVARFSGVPWPLEAKPEPDPDPKKEGETAKADALGVNVAGVKVKQLIKTRCVWCHSKGGEKEEIPFGTYDDLSKYLVKTTDHPKGHLHTVLTGSPKNWNKKSMVKAFFEKSADWEDLSPAERKRQTPQREAERLALVAWVEAGAPKAPYEADAFALPDGFKFQDLPEGLRTTAAPAAPTAVGAAEKAADKWKEAKRRQLSVDALTQSTHAHLLTFAVLWAATGFIFAFTTYPAVVRGLLAPLVLVAQVADVACWWLARLDPPTGPYFALAIMATGAIVGLGLAAQIVLSLWNMYGAKGKLVLVVLFLAGAGLFGLTYIKVIEPQLQAERAVQAG